MAGSILNNPFFWNRIIELPSVDLTAAANTVVWNPGTGTGTLISIEFNLVNPNTTTERYVIAGVDYAATGALTHSWFSSYIPANAQTGWLGPYIITANDDIMAWQTVGTDVDMHFRVLVPQQYAIGGP